MKKLKVITFILINAIVFVSCRKEKINSIASEYFPCTIGDYWEYDVYDSSYLREHPNIPREYAVKVSITGIQKLVDSIDAYVWQYQFPWGNEINYVRIVGDTVKTFDTVYSKTIRDLLFPRKVYVIPFHDGQRWDGKLLFIDSSHVNKLPSVITKSETFMDCFGIFYHYMGPNLEYNDTYWFKPNIGMLKIYYNHYNLASRTMQLWQLKKFYLH